MHFKVVLASVCVRVLNNNTYAISVACVFVR